MNRIDFADHDLTFRPWYTPIKIVDWVENCTIPDYGYARCIMHEEMQNQWNAFIANEQSTKFPRENLAQFDSSKLDELL